MTTAVKILNEGVHNVDIVVSENGTEVFRATVHPSCISSTIWLYSGKKIEVVESTTQGA